MGRNGSLVLRLECLGIVLCGFRVVLGGLFLAFLLLALRLLLGFTGVLVVEADVVVVVVVVGPFGCTAVCEVTGTVSEGACAFAT